MWMVGFSSPMTDERLSYIIRNLQNTVQEINTRFSLISSTEKE